MTLAEWTGRKRRRRCRVCLQVVMHSQKRVFHTPRGSLEWSAEGHAAPCGAHCIGGGVRHGEADVHIPLLRPCPRCGAEEGVVDRIIVRPDGLERVIIYRYTASWLRDLGHRIQVETLQGREWTRKGWWGGD